MDGVSKTRIEANLRRWATSGIDHKNPDHVAAYLLVRQQHERPRPEHVLAAIKSQKATHSNSASMSSDFFLVLKEHFSKTPSWLEKWETQEDELRKSFKVPMDCDLSTVWIVDGGCPREQLGKGVRRISFEQKLVSSQTTTAMDSLRAALPAAAIASGSTARREMDSPPLAREVSAASAPEVKVTAADTRQVEPKQPPSKKQRVLKLMQSDEQQPVEDIESASLEELIIKIKRAATAGMLYAPPSASTATVHVWATQVLEAIRSSLGKAKAKAAPHSPKQVNQTVPAAPAVPESWKQTTSSDPQGAGEGGEKIQAAATAPDTAANALAAAARAPGSSADAAVQPPAAAAPARQGSMDKRASLLMTHFPGFLIKVLYNAKCWTVLKHFVTLLGELKTLGCTAPCNLEALDAFATTAPDNRDVTFSSFAVEGLTERVKFFSSPMYKNFLERRADALLKKAREQKDLKTFDEWIELYGAAAHSLEGEEGVKHQRQLAWARTIFVALPPKRPELSSSWEVAQIQLRRQKRVRALSLDCNSPRALKNGLTRPWTLFCCSGA